MPLLYDKNIQPKPGDIIFYDTQDNSTLGLWNKFIKKAQGSTVTHVGILYGIIPLHDLEIKKTSVLSDSWQENESVAILIDAISGGINIGPIGNYHGRVYRWEGQGEEAVRTRIASYAYSCGYNPKTWDQYAWGQQEKHLYQGNGGSYTVLQPLQVPFVKGFVKFDTDVFQGKKSKYYLRHLPGWGQSGYYKNSWYCSKFVTQTLQIAIRSYYDDVLRCLLKWLVLYLQAINFELNASDTSSLDNLFGHLLGEVWEKQQCALFKDKLLTLPKSNFGYVAYLQQVFARTNVPKLREQVLAARYRLEKLDKQYNFQDQHCIFNAVSLYHKLLLLSHYFDLNTKFISVIDLLKLLESHTAFTCLGHWRNTDNRVSEIYHGLKCYRDGNWLAPRYVSKRQTNYVGKTLINASFDAENLQGADFSNTHLINVSFRKANLTGANFIKARLKNIDCSQANLTHTLLSHLQDEEYNCCVGEPEQTFINLLLVGAHVRSYFKPSQKHTGLFDLISFLEAERAKKLSSTDWFIECCQWLLRQKSVVLFPKKTIIKRYLIFTGLYMGLDSAVVYDLVDGHCKDNARLQPVADVISDESAQPTRRNSECSVLSWLSV